MNVDGSPYRSIWLNEDGKTVDIIDQTRLPHEFRLCSLETLEDAAVAIKSMQVRGAPLIGATAAYGVALAMAFDHGTANLDHALETLLATRPTAVNLRWALERGRRVFEAHRGSGAEATEELTMQINDAVIQRKNKQQFIATLKTSGAAFDRGSLGAG